ncbi:hemolysin [Rhizobium sp. CSW-27]|uniref:M10 family metallopeptidase C-terminal domain-containing protein n=1 Tax=Rhizobium sp. CSW-27 TaxID=2839985 RepID=UPI001C01C6AC|nr:hemolysin [Rhizobium sp. CSW-27]MBT9368970.1 hemolysin [Rhizobium sp. CSW-27]
MVAKIYQYAGAEDIKAYLTAWTALDPLSGHGDFYPASTPFSQWAGGDEGGSRPVEAVLLEGSFTYPANGGFVGTVNTLTFGEGLSGGGSTPYSIDTVELLIDLGGATPNTTFNYAIYQLMGTAGTASAASLYSYLGIVGTEQYGTTGDDTQYSFAGSDTFFGDSGEDTFVFLSTSNGADTITDFVIGDDLIDFSSVTAFTSFTDVASAVTANAAGDAVITWSGGSVTLTGHSAATFSMDFSSADILV